MWGGCVAFCCVRIGFRASAHYVAVMVAVVVAVVVAVMGTGGHCCACVGPNRLHHVCVVVVVVVAFTLTNFEPPVVEIQARAADSVEEKIPGRRPRAAVLVGVEVEVGRGGRGKV